MDIDDHIDQLEADGAMLAAAAQEAGLDAAITHCPDWTVRELLTHIGEVHRWAAAIVGQALPSPELPAGSEIDTKIADDELIDWFRDGHRALVDTLRAAPADLDCWHFLAAPSPLAFWARRQALETVVHRVDAETAGGSITPIEAALALDGIDEILVGFGGRRRSFEPGVLRVDPQGGTPWNVTLTADGLTAVPTPGDDGTADATVAGAASEVYLWLWNRPAAVSITGDAAVADQWKNVKVRWS